MDGKQTRYDANIERKIGGKLRVSRYVHSPANFHVGLDTACCVVGI